MSLLLPVLLVPLAAAPRVVDRIAAIVNGESVTLSELVERAGPDYGRAEDMRPGEAREQARAKALKAAFDGLVAEKLLRGQVAALGVEVSPAQVDAAIEDIKRRNHFTDRMLDEALASQGLDRPAFRTQVQRDLEAYQVLNVKVRSRVKVTDEDVRNYYQTNRELFGGDDEVKVRHIFLAVAAGAGAEEEARVRAAGRRILERLAAGEDFAKVAAEVSQGPSASEGGDLGWLRRGTVQPELERAAFALGAGGVSDLVKTRAGLHILKVEARRRGGARTFEEAKEEIRDRLANEQVEAFRNQYVAELRKDALIETRIPELKDRP